MADWRVIYTGFSDGYYNMALDEALLENFAEGSAPVLRLYGWEPAAVSVGRFQKLDGFLDVEACRAKGIPVVRRITGGGMIYHHRELTYSIVCTPEQLGTGRKPLDAYRRICGFLLEFYLRLGLDADFAVNLEAGHKGGRENFCFAANERYDIIINGRKIGGNAQRWLKHAVFQHGSIPYESSLKEASGLLLSEPDNIMSSSTSLTELGVTDQYPELFRLMGSTFFAKTVQSDLTEQETASAERLLKEKYTKNSWNLDEDKEKA
jgi:lipoyl(octanoyl) transferase